jgi:serine/threonine/tyrosine-interacting protein
LNEERIFSPEEFHFHHLTLKMLRGGGTFTYRESAMSDNPSHHQRLEEYTAQIPAPPRIHIPPPLIKTDQGEGITLSPPRYNEDPEYRVDFLTEAISGHRICRYLGDWTYHSRREAQEILPFLYLGPASSATKEYLSKENFTFVVGISLEPIYFISRALKVAEQLNIESFTMVVKSQVDLISDFSNITRHINNHLVRQHQAHLANPLIHPSLTGKVLLVCETGSDKSAAVAVAYLMETFENTNLQKAMQIVITCRFSCNLTPFTTQLAAYEQVLRARSSLAHSPKLDVSPTIIATIGHGIERERTPDVNENFRRARDQFLHNVDDEEFADRERFSGRHGPQPFKSED